MKKFSIILPVYKNEKNLPVTIPYIMDRLSLFLNYEVEVILVCDGSPDKSYEVMKEYQAMYSQNIKIVNLLKNSGQRAAVNCGMKIAKGDVIGVISADLQDPFELFAEMLNYWEQGCPFVIAKRKGRAEKGIGAFCSNLLHKFINKNINKNYPIGGFDFYLIDKKIAKEFIISDTHNNSMQLLLLELGGSAKQIEYVRKKREIGSSGWSLMKKLNQALNIFAVYSDKPFRYFLRFSILCLIISFVMFLYGLFSFTQNADNAFFCIVISLILLGIGSVNGLLSVMGLYQFKWMQNDRNMPRYIIDDMIDETEEDKA